MSHAVIGSTMRSLTLLLFTILFLSCNEGQTKKDYSLVSVPDSSDLKKGISQTELINDSTHDRRVVYVISREGADIYKLPDPDSDTLGHYEYGAQLDVVDETEEWYAVRERISNRIKQNDKNLDVTGWEIVHVLKSKTGELSDITLIPSDLRILSSFTRNQKTESFESQNELNGYLNIELISREQFESQKITRVSFLARDTNEIKKKDGVISLKCGNKVKRYIDKPDAEESSQVYKYIGQVPFLNAYLVGGSYFENLDYSFVDKNNCEEIQTFGEFPHISPDRKHIVCIYANPYVTTADLELFSVSGKQIRPVIRASFRNWMPALSDELFWGTDNYLYVPVNHSMSFWKHDGSLNNKFQYIRMRVL